MADATAGLLAGGAGVVANAAIGPFGALVAPAALLARKRWQRAVRRRELAATEALEVAAELVGGLKILEERTEHDDRRLELLARVIEAAGRTTLKSKIRALGRVLAEGLGEEEGAVDEAMELAAALNDLEALHVEVLDRMDKVPTPPESLRRQPDVAAQGWELSELSAALPHLGVLDSLLSTLSGHGLVIGLGGVTYPGNVGPPVWRITPLGQRCLFLLDPEPRS